MSELLEPYCLLSELIHERKRKLLIYKSKPNANKPYIEQEEAFIFQLDEVLRGINFFKLHPVYLKMHTQIHELLRIDPELETFRITVNIKPPTNKQAQFTINTYLK